MQLLPVATRFYKIDYSRKILVGKLTQLTFLSDKNFKSDKNRTYTFYGDISDYDFYLENIQPNPQTTAILDGRILGVENEIYLRITHRLWAKTTTPVLLFLTILLSTAVFIHTWLSQYIWYASINPEPGYLTKVYSTNVYPENPLAFAVAIAIIAMAWLYKKKLNDFKDQINKSEQYLNNTLQTTQISQSQIPIVFR